MFNFLEGLLEIESDFFAIPEGVAFGVPGGASFIVALDAGFLAGNLHDDGGGRFALALESAEFHRVFGVAFGGPVAGFALDAIVWLNFGVGLVEGGSVSGDVTF